MTLRKIIFEIWNDIYQCNIPEGMILKMISYKNSSDEVVILKYDAKARMISRFDYEFNEWETFEYIHDERGNLICLKGSMSDPEIYKYDDNNNLIYFKSYGDPEEWYTYDQRGNMIHKKHSSTIASSEEWYEYDEKNRLIHFMRSWPKEDISYEYNEDGTLKQTKEDEDPLQIKTSKEVLQEFDDLGNITYRKLGEMEEWFEYEIISEL